MPEFNGQPLHYDIVGSFLRPKELKDARKDFEHHAIDHDQLTKVENDEITKLVAKEKEVGLKIVTDGEFRRSYWHLDTFWGFDGIKHTKQEHGYFFHNLETRNDSAQVEGKIKFNSNHPDLSAYKFLYNLTKDDDSIVARQSIPSPAQLYTELVRDPTNIAALEKFYGKDTDALVHDIGKAYHDLILALYEVGCRDVKLDDCTWGVLSDKKLWNVFAENGQSVDDLKQLYLRFNNEAIKDLPDDLRISTHVCRGNYASTWAASGGYQPVAHTLFAEENVDAYYLEFDDDRSGDFAPLNEVTPGKEVVLGLVTSKQPELENPENLVKRIHEAAEFVPLDKLSLSTQCGFASTEEGNHLTEKQQWKKIKLVIDTANEVWQTVEN
ncbi:5-methyltetrahydropteroyltriglutamate--homocysteine S-methyltransferase [Nicoliella spurrieriana]|uniref:5-methyltetrahydropteroyltriglutamate--homocysteine S-methyltransferase n=1 Tax=Nicoliella spurrieriana TaxID=2925830 RepID=A0A976X673_9LACO|nr:5-methyltetrahydropteroyltriglutamate--homocysteine S-methyltransferase [Nicoliella spurrieriana]UQS87299.1 5-methyltetrahydropteroyltriglutamate--homocysteine S-methyltransferase [Nicoliella spurrieriana]